jgi:hypothetical protein
MQQLTLSQITPGTWYRSDQYIPQDFVRVLCANQDHHTWFAYVTTNGYWSTTYGLGVFVWQFVAFPVDEVFEVLEVILCHQI